MKSQEEEIMAGQAVLHVIGWTLILSIVVHIALSIVVIGGSILLTSAIFGIQTADSLAKTLENWQPIYFLIVVLIAYIIAIKITFKNTVILKENRKKSVKIMAIVVIAEFLLMTVYNIANIPMALNKVEEEVKSKYSLELTLYGAYANATKDDEHTYYQNKLDEIDANIKNRVDKAKPTLYTTFAISTLIGAGINCLYVLYYQKALKKYEVDE